MDPVLIKLSPFVHPGVPAPSQRFCGCGWGVPAPLQPPGNRSCRGGSAKEMSSSKWVREGGWRVQGTVLLQSGEEQGVVEV